MPQGILDSQRMYSQSGVPHPLRSDVYSQATTPGVGVLTKNPSYITINRSGSYGFIYQHTGSIGSTIAAGDIAYTTGSVTGDSGVSSGPIRLDINPTAWRRNDAAGAVGDVTFVYRGQ